MANALAITINDARKAATCREVVALCSTYTATISPALSGAGKLVLFRKRVLYPPVGAQVYKGDAVINYKCDQWDANEVYAVANLTTTNGITTGTLDLRYETLVRDYVSRYGVGSEAQLFFGVFDTVGGGLAGYGEFRLKVVEPFYITQDQDLVMFKGEKGDDGEDGQDGQDGEDGQDGQDGVTPHIGANNHWFIGDTDTEIVARGQDGQNGSVCTIGANKNWYIDGQDTGVVAEGQNGSVCTIGQDGYWYIDGVKQNVRAVGEKGDNGTTPHIGAGNHWFIGTTDTGIVAKGEDGEDGTDGDTPVIGENNHWWIGGVDTGVNAKGIKGDTGPMGDGSYIFDSVDGKWHQVTVYTDPVTGEKTTSVNPIGTDTRPGIYGTHASTHAAGGSDPITPQSIGALPATTTIPTKTSDLTNDSGFLTEHQSLANYQTKITGDDDKVLAAHLPSYVDDVLEYASTSAFPAAGETGKIYVALNTNKTYRWGGTAYVEISPSLAIGETAGTAYEGSKGKANEQAIAAEKQRAEAAEALKASSEDLTNHANSDVHLTANQKTIISNASTHMGTANIHVPIQVVSSSSQATQSGVIYFITGS